MDLTAKELLDKYETLKHESGTCVYYENVLMAMEEYAFMKWKQACKAQREACKDKAYDLLYNDGNAETWAEKISKTKLVEYDDELEFED